MRMFTLIIASLLLTTVVLMAHNIQKRGHGSFSSFDRNNNYSISGKEFNRHGTHPRNRMFQSSSMRNRSYSYFTDIDGNNDNSISLDEFNTHQKEMRERRYQMRSFMSGRRHGNWDESVKD